MLILVKGDDVRSGTRDKAGHGQLQAASTGVNGLISIKL